MKTSEEDMIRLLEARNDIRAVADPATLTPDPKYQEPLAASRDELAEARADLRDKVAYNIVEQGQTDVERTRAQRALTKAQEFYGFYRRRTRDALFDPGPGVKIEADEIQRRQRLYDRYFALNQTELSQAQIDRQVEVFEGVLDGVAREPEIAALGYGPELEPVFKTAMASVAELRRETDEDLLATRALNVSRTNFDRAHRAHIRLVESLLIRHDRDDDARYFLKRRDPAYAARRRARVPVAQEPEAPAIEQELSPTEEPTPA